MPLGAIKIVNRDITKNDDYVYDAGDNIYFNLGRAKTIEAGPRTGTCYARL